MEKKPMKNTMIRSLLAAIALGVAGGAVAQQNPLEDAIKNRQAGYKFMAWNMGKIKAQAVDGTVPFNKDQMLNAALAIKGIANSGMGALYLAGTDTKSAPIKTRALPDIFDPKNVEERNKIGGNFVQQANKLAEVAAGGDQAAIKAQFGELGKACKACHDKFREEEKK
jgi:cytochrome c556